MVKNLEEARPHVYQKTLYTPTKDEFKYLSQELDSDVLDLVNQKIFYPYEYIGDFGKFIESLPSKEKCYSLLAGKKIRHKDYELVLKVCDRIQKKTMKDYHDLYLKCDVLLFADMFEKFRNSSLKYYGLCPSHYFRLGCNAQYEKKLSLNLF